VVQKSLDPEWNEVFVLLLADMPENLSALLKLTDVTAKSRLST